MPQTTATATQSHIASGSWQVLTLQNLSASVPVFVARKTGVTATGANGGLRVEPGGVLVLTADRREPSGPWVITASSTAVLAWETLGATLATPDSVTLTAALAALTVDNLGQTSTFTKSLLKAADKAAVNALLV